ncbi:DUF4132 domain-containing protein [Paenibacillus xylanilyticus]|uniref:DUF4132 domain-containing protein n=1 Tax=Paenibacillus xylanilyticus TaxID=248903 RepID=A0A7Y6BZX5_9BACL|nr:DUF4132 domain-containing protein [Paenibacillus xylanilyticus]NUU78074.1 DUF4132 domain-containing protein [Paenibacillus xylanilyticus]
MNQNDNEQVYIKSLQEKAVSLKGIEQELAGYVVEMAGFTYLRGDEKAYLNTEQILRDRAADTQNSLFEPLLNVLGHLVNEPLVERFRYIADRATNYPYSIMYERRPFRSLDPELHIGQVIRKLIGLMRMEIQEFSLDEYVSLREYKFDYLYEIRSVLPDCIAYELDHLNGGMKQALHEIIYGDNQSALLTGEMIKGIFMSDQAEAYQMVGELLVAARLQEGLRQSIVERMDEGTIEAFVYILKVIIDHNLIRFSSVVRALAVWTGIGIDAANARVAAQLIEQAYEALTDTGVRETWMQDSNANKLFISLWATAVIEENNLQDKLIHIMDHGPLYQKIVAQYVLANSQNRELRLNIARRYLAVQDLELLHWIVQNYDAMYMHNWRFENGENQRSIYISPLPVFADKTIRRHDFDQFKQLLALIPQGGEGGQSGVLEYVHYRVDRDDVVKKMLYLAAYDMDPDWIGEVIAVKDKLSPELRGELLSQFVQHPENEVQRQFIFDSLSDKSINNRESALAKAKQLTLTGEELMQMEALLKLKTGSLRQKVIQVLLLQPVEQLKASVERLLQAKSELQRLGALELLTEIAADPERTDQHEQLQPSAGLIQKPTSKEQKLLDKLTEEGSRYTASNGFGLFDPSRVEPLLQEKRDLSGFSPKDIFTLSLEKAKPFMEGLDALVHQHRDHEYEVEYYAGYRETLLIGASLRSMVSYAERNNMKQMEQYPLHEVWEEYVAQSDLNGPELMQLYFVLQFSTLNGSLNEHYSYYHDQYDYNELSKIPLLEGWRKSFAEQTYPLVYMEELKQMAASLTYKDQVAELISAAFKDSNPAETFEIAEKTWASIIASMPEEQLEKETGMLHILTERWNYLVRSRIYDDASFQRFFQTAYQFINLVGNTQRFSLLSFEDYLRAFKLRLIDDQTMYRQLLTGGDRLTFIRDLTWTRTEGITDDPELVELRNTVVERILEIELTRGELSTEVSTLAMKFGRIEGMEHWVHLVSAMDKDTFVRGYIYSYGDNTTRKETFSHLIQVCHPRDGEDEKLLRQLLEQHPIPEKKLLEAAMYAPQWMEIVSKYLGWEGLRSAAWYFHAHINERFTAEKETIVAHYSPISPQEFNDGAFDIAWFEEAYAAVGEERFNLLYDCAKYISGGSNHRRSQLFADAALGKLHLEDMRQSVQDKRNKDHLLTYSLIPFQEQQEQDLRERYNFIQKFLLESKEFGAQRRASEGAAAQIALGNLARNAGYTDVTRLIWNMEASKLDEMKSYFEPKALDETTTAQLVIDEEGQSELVLVSKGKSLKSVPARFKKDGYITELKEIKGDLVLQYRRARQELERSMTAETAFTVQEIASLMQNPVIRPLIRTLVFQSGERLGYFDRKTSGGCLIVPGQQHATHSLTDQDNLVIAHPLQLLHSGTWSEFQRDLFTRQERQPFKQVFRELYLPNEDELANGTVSRRYAGYQIQPKKAVALLKGRQWTVSYEEGLQKVSYEHNLIANLYAMADWFSPADTEAPTLETVQFYDRKTYKPVALKDVPPLFFSEVMRDVDLVVSVAHVGGVDPEASLTTIEMRHVIVNESLRLLKIDNVRLDGNYARIEGALGEYAVHLGSGNVFKQATGALYIVPVHSQHRGRIFLPFLDEDPRTAEILSKIMLLAEDTKIKDPQILAQLRS